MKPALDRKTLLRKSEKDLLKECKKYHIDPKLYKKKALRKLDLVDLIVTQSNPNYIGNHKKKKKKVARNRNRSHSVAETLTSYKSKTKTLIKKSKNKPYSNTTDCISFNKAKNRLKRTKSVNDAEEAAAVDVHKFDIMNSYKRRRKKANHPYDAIFPELRIKSLLDLNSIHSLNENTSTECEIKTETFKPHLSLKEVAMLQVNDCIDFRADDGLSFAASIVDKSRSVLTLTFKSDNHNLQSTECDYNEELYRFAAFESLTKRGSHRMDELKRGSAVDIKPVTQNQWMIGEVINRNKTNGFIHIEYNHKNKKHMFWTHTDNKEEIAPYLTHCDIANLLDDIDRDTHYNCQEWNCCDIKDWFMKLENGKFGNNIKYKPLKDAFEKYDMNYEDLTQINELALKILGIKLKKDRKTLLNEIHKVIAYMDSDKEQELIQLKQKIRTQEEEIAFLKSKKKKTKKPTKKPKITRKTIWKQEKKAQLERTVSIPIYKTRKKKKKKTDLSVKMEEKPSEP